MKRLIPFSFVCLMFWPLMGQPQALPEEVRQALRDAMRQVAPALETSGVDSTRSITLLPPEAFLDDAPRLAAASRYLEGLLKTAVTQAGFPAVEPVDRTVWENAVRMIEVHERKGGERAGVLDPAFLNQFGKLRLAQQLMTYELIDARSDGRRVLVELAVHLYDLETNTHVWGDIFVQRHYLPENVQGLVDLTPEARSVLREMMAKAEISMAKQSAVAQLNNVAILPLSGDVDRYITQLGRDALSRAGVTPRELAIRTEAEARTVLQNQPSLAEAALVGAVRDLFVEELPAENLTDRRYRIHAEVQLAILAAESLDVLWSDTLQQETEFVEAGPGLDQQFLATLLENPIYIAYGLGGLVILLVLFKLIKATQRVR